MDLNTIWFLLIGILITGYAILDGFDLGIGSLYYVLGKNQEEKNQLIGSIGPFWDGNEVWLLTGGGALFAAFPIVYASVFSGFYLAMMLVLFGLILRAVSIEFRNKFDEPVWQRRLDFTFFLGSLLPALLFGVAVGNVAKGLPLDSNQNFTGTFLSLLNPYSLLIGVIGLSAFLMQGATFAMMKTDGTVLKRAKAIFNRIWLSTAILFAAGSLYTYQVAPNLFSNYFNYPILYFVPLLVAIGLALAQVAVARSRYGTAFLGSSLVIAGMILTLAAGMFPNWVPAVKPEFSLTIYNAASSPLTLKTMLIIALMGIPVVLFYTVYVYRVFKGKNVKNESVYQ